MTGTIKTLVRDRGFGFITSEATGRDHFFHWAAVIGVRLEELSIGERVLFDEEPSDRGPRATNVRPLDDTKG